MADSSLSADDARNLMLLVTVGYVGTLILWGLATASAGVLLLARSGVERIVGGLGVFVLVLAVIFSFSWADSGLFAPGLGLIFPYFGTLLFIAAVSVLMLRTAEPPAA